MLYVNLFRDGSALLECQPQGDASIPVHLPDNHLAELLALLNAPETSVAMAALFRAGVTVGERQSRVALPRSEQALAAAGTSGN